MKSRRSRLLLHGRSAAAHFRLRLAHAILMAVAAPALAVADARVVDADWTIVPGVRVGPITATTTEAMLPLLLPHAAPKRGRIYIGEGEERPSTVLFARTPDELHVVWLGDAFQQIEELRLANADAHRRPRWRTTMGITLGTTLDELHALNGGRFELFGFRWDYGGTLISWKGGRLATTHDLDKLLVIRFSPVAPIDTLGLTPEEDDSITGERTIQSTAPALTKLRLFVSEIIVRVRR